MALQYAPRLPVDASGQPMQEYPSPKLALARYASENSSVSSVVSVTHDTTAVEVAAIGGPAVLKWITAGSTNPSVISIAGGTANFDHVVGTGTVRRFVIPIESATTPSSVQGVNRLNGLYQRVAIKSIGVASVLLAEF